MKFFQKFSLFVLLWVMAFGTVAQNVELTFTGRDSCGNYVRLNQVYIQNHSQNWTETLVWPDTTLLLINVTDIVEPEASMFPFVGQNVPNPFDGVTELAVNLVEGAPLHLAVYNVAGILISEYRGELTQGVHRFRISVAKPQACVVVARSGVRQGSVKILNNGHGSSNGVEYVGNSHFVQKGLSLQPFVYGDQMSYTGTATISGHSQQSATITQTQNGSEAITLIFDVSIPVDGPPCPGTPTLTDIDGNTYNTVQIGNQCWMKENLRTKKYANGTTISQGSETSTTTAYWYYPNNSSSNMSTYGLLYNWPAVMGSSSSSSTNPSGVQGICPTGWHVPSDAEWTQLTDYVSSQSQYVCGSTTTQIAKALAGTAGWSSSTNTCAVGYTPSNNNATGFSALPAGIYDGSYYSFGYGADFWSATEYSSTYAYFRGLSYYDAGVGRGYYNKGSGFSVRCLRDEGSSSQSVPTVTTSSVSSIGTTSATCGGNVTSDGGATVTARGVCWSTSQNPTISDSHTTNGTGTGSFTSSLTGLAQNTTYYVRAYATNSVGTAYGSEVNFTTTQDSSTTDDGFSYYVDDVAFIPDGPYCDTPCYSSSVNCTSFSPNATITQPSDILSVCLNIEHSFIGDVNISIICPNGNSALLMPDHNQNHYSGGNNFAYLGQYYKPDGSDKCNPAENPPGTGWNYCWSENSLYAQNSGYCFISANIGNDVAQTVDSSHIAYGYPGQIGFVQGQQYYTPYESFSNLIGCPINGIWQIQVCDTWGSDNGYVFGWGIVFNPISGSLSQNGQPCPGTPTLSDIDGNTYNTVQIGDQCWMKENLRTKKYANGTSISQGSSTSATTAYWYYPNGNSSNMSTYGLLYNWPAVMWGSAPSSANPSGVQGICPTGWHVPSDAEWTHMEMAVGMNQSDADTTGFRGSIAARLCGNTGWTSSSNANAAGNISASDRNSSGFSALPAGYNDGSSNGFGDSTEFWSATELESSYAWYRYLNYDEAGVVRFGYNKSTGRSVRCLRD